MTKLPAPLRTIADALSRDTQTNDAIRELTSRGDMDKTRATLAGIAINPQARERWNDSLDRIFAASPPKVKSAPEIVVGSGVHSAIYATNRVANGHPAPTILEAKSRAGGAFAVTNNPSFFLNSRNRPGPLGLPSYGDALNVLPNSPIQPSDLSGTEFQRNSDLAFVVRTALAMHSTVHTDVVVDDVENVGDTFTVRLANGDEWTTPRVIVATGLGNPFNALVTPESELSRDPRIMDYYEFLARFDQPFPLRGLGRVAVIGAGDSGRTTIEALTGKGPSPQMSVSALDWVDQIDWYGLGDGQNCDLYASQNRSRYKGIAGLLPQGDRKGRVTPRPNAQSLSAGVGCVYVNERPYDHVIVCTGFQETGALGKIRSRYGYDVHNAYGRDVGQRYSFGTDRDIFVVGPAANLTLTEIERKSTPAFDQADENKTALFRYADRTAALAKSLAKTRAPRRKVAKRRAKATGVIPIALSPEDVKRLDLRGGLYTTGYFKQLDPSVTEIEPGLNQWYNAYGQRISTGEDNKTFYPDREIVLVPAAATVAKAEKSKAKRVQLSQDDIRRYKLEGGGSDYGYFRQGDLNVTEGLSNNQWYNNYGQRISPGKDKETAETFYEGREIVLVPAEAEKPKTKRAKRGAGAKAAQPRKLKPTDAITENRTGSLKYGSDGDLFYSDGYYVNDYGQSLNGTGAGSNPSKARAVRDVYRPDLPILFGPDKGKTFPDQPVKLPAAEPRKLEGIVAGLAPTGPARLKMYFTATDNYYVNDYGQRLNRVGKYGPDGPYEKAAELRGTYKPDKPIEFGPDKGKTFGGAKPKRKSVAKTPPAKLTRAEARKLGVRFGGVYYRNRRNEPINAYGQIVGASDDYPRMKYPFDKFIPNMKVTYRAGVKPATAKADKPKPFTIAEAAAKGIIVNGPGEWFLRGTRRVNGTRGKPTRLNRWGQQITDRDPGISRGSSPTSAFQTYYPRRKKLI